MQNKQHGERCSIIRVDDTLRKVPTIDGCLSMPSPKPSESALARGSMEKNSSIIITLAEKDGGNEVKLEILFEIWIGRLRWGSRSGSRSCILCQGGWQDFRCGDSVSAIVEIFVVYYAICKRNSHVILLF